jgi:hypothetical protein
LFLPAKQLASGDLWGVLEFSEKEQSDPSLTFVQPRNHQEEHRPLNIIRYKCITNHLFRSLLAADVCIHNESYYSVWNYYEPFICPNL